MKNHVVVVVVAVAVAVVVVVGQVPAQSSDSEGSLVT